MKENLWAPLLEHKTPSKPLLKRHFESLEDPRKTGLKNGLRQLTIEQLQRIIDYPGEMVLDTYNYQDGNFCALAIGVGLDETMTDPSHEKVFQTLTDMGYSVYNTRGIQGKFYTEHRLEDLCTAIHEVIEEKMEVDESEFDLEHYALLIVGGGCTARDEELREAIKGIEKHIGTGYYEGDGDALLQHIVTFLKSNIHNTGVK